jgi:integrase
MDSTNQKINPSSLGEASSREEGSLVRSPRFEPGSSAWQADVLDQTSQDSHPTTQDLGGNLVARLRPQATRQLPAEILKAIVDTQTSVRGDGQTEHTVKQLGYKLKEITRNCDIFNPEEVREYIATATHQKTKKPLAADTKNRLAYLYNKFCEKHNIIWNKPYYKVEEQTPLIPTRDNVNAIISNASKRYVPIFTILAEIGAEGHELENVTQSDIDTEQGIIRIRGCKGHASGTYKLKPQTAEMLRAYLHENPQEHPFPNSHSMSQVWVDTRRRASKKLCKPELDKIPFKNLRNYSGAQLYLNMPVRDPIAVMRHLRHKKLETTMHYIRGIVLDEDPTYTCRTATTPQESAALIEEGFEYITGTFQDGGKQFRKRK